MTGSGWNAGGKNTMVVQRRGPCRKVYCFEQHLNKYYIKFN